MTPLPFAIRLPPRGKSSAGTPRKRAYHAIAPFSMIEAPPEQKSNTASGRARSNALRYRTVLANARRARIGKRGGGFAICVLSISVSSVRCGSVDCCRSRQLVITPPNIFVPAGGKAPTINKRGRTGLTVALPGSRRTSTPWRQQRQSVAGTPCRAAAFEQSRAIVQF